MELDPDVLRAKFKTSVAISTIGVIVPFACSIPVSWLLFNTDDYALESGYPLPLPPLFVCSFSVLKCNSYGNFLLFVGVAMGVSALPVLARILAERRMLQNQLGVVTMAATAIGTLFPLLLSLFHPLFYPPPLPRKRQGLAAFQLKSPARFSGLPNM